jgi:hypothetical protein
LAQEALRAWRTLAVTLEPSLEALLLCRLEQHVCSAAAPRPGSPSPQLQAAGHPHTGLHETSRRMVQMLESWAAVGQRDLLPQLLAKYMVTFSSWTTPATSHNSKPFTEQAPAVSFDMRGAAWAVMVQIEQGVARLAGA